ncbi:hypothetical protein SAMN03159293_04070 [Pseudomonas sp. NFACC39-1]|nr:hypothetical protein SAMN03159293_04070 [Pseudomonas sp. NFACC39-1]
MSGTICVTEKRGRPPWTLLELSESAIDSQVLPVDSFRRYGVECLKRDIHLLSSPPLNERHPKDFISLKP